MTWPVHDAKARFSESLDASLDEGPQVPTRRGVETAVLVSIEAWKRLNAQARPSIKDVLLSPKCVSRNRTAQFWSGSNLFRITIYISLQS